MKALLEGQSKKDIEKMILDYKQLLIDYLTFWKQRDFRFLVENQHLQNKIISLKTKLLNLKFFE